MDAIVLQIQDGHHKFQPIRSLITNSRWWRPRKSAMLENSPPASTEDWDRSHGFPWWHKSSQGHAKKCHATSTSILTVSRGPSDKRPWWRLRDLCPRHLYTFLFIPKHPGTVTSSGPNLDLSHSLRGQRGKNRGEGYCPFQSIVGRWPHWEPILDLSHSLLSQRGKIGIRGYSLLVCYIKPSHVLKETKQSCWLRKWKLEEVKDY